MVNLKNSEEFSVHHRTPSKSQHLDIVVPFTSMSQALGQPMVDLHDGIKTKNEKI